METYITTALAIQQLADALAHNATTFPPSESLSRFISESEYRRLSKDRLRFGISIANEVINVKLINTCTSFSDRAKVLIDLVHHAFFKIQGKKDIRIGDIIVAPAELSQISREIQPSTNGYISNVQQVRTNWWSLMDMVYLSRQQTYYEALKAWDGSKLPSAGISPTTLVASLLASHLTGADAKSGGDSFITLTVGIDAFLTIYANRTRDMLPNMADDKTPIVSGPVATRNTQPVSRPAPTSQAVSPSIRSSSGRCPQCGAPASDHDCWSCGAKW